MTDSFYAVQNPNNEINIVIPEEGIREDPELRALLDTNASYRREINRLTSETEDFVEVINALDTRTELPNNFFYESLMETYRTQGEDAFRAQLRARLASHGRDMLHLQHYQSLSQEIQDVIRRFPIPVANITLTSQIETSADVPNPPPNLEARRHELNVNARQEARRAAEAARASAEASQNETNVVVPLSDTELNVYTRQEARRAAEAARASAEAARAAAEDTDIVYEGRI